MKNNLIVILCFTAGIFCGIRKDDKGYPVFQFATAVLYDHRHVSILCGGKFVIDLVEYI